MRILMLSLFLVGCGGGQASIADLDTADPGRVVPEANAVLDDWHDAAAHADEERYFGHFSADAIFLGTDATERWDVEAFRAYAHPHFADGRAWTFRAVRREVIVHEGGGLVWFDEDLQTENLGPARGSGVLRRSPDGRLRIAHYNLTITVPNDRFGEVRSLLAGQNTGDPQREGTARTPQLDCDGCERGCDPSGGGCCRLEEQVCPDLEEANCGVRIGCQPECCATME